MEKIETSAGVIKTNHPLHISPMVFELYRDYNKKQPWDQLEINELYELTKMVCEKIGIYYNPSHFKSLRDLSLPVINKNKKTVVLGFSGGLDSVYQAICLKEQGYEVILYHLKNINTYENGQATKQCREIADKLGLKYIESTISKTRGSQEVPENPLKNELILSLMIDYCLEYNIPYISLGDDLNLSLKDSVVGINVTDSKELTKSFMKGIHMVIPEIEFLPITTGEKLDRIKKLIEYGLGDDYYSCVQAGRFNKKLHDLNESKYRIKLFDRNCGCSCRKCAMHNLLIHYGNIKSFPQDFIDSCWKVLWKNSYSADYELFKPDLPEKVRIHNLFTY